MRTNARHEQENVKPFSVQYHMILASSASTYARVSTRVNTYDRQATIAPKCLSTHTEIEAGCTQSWQTYKPLTTNNRMKRSASHEKQLVSTHTFPLHEASSTESASRVETPHGGERGGGFRVSGPCNILGLM